VVAAGAPFIMASSASRSEKSTSNLISNSSSAGAGAGVDAGIVGMGRGKDLAAAEMGRAADAGFCVAAGVVAGGLMDVGVWEVTSFAAVAPGALTAPVEDGLSVFFSVAGIGVGVDAGTLGEFESRDGTGGLADILSGPLA